MATTVVFVPGWEKNLILPVHRAIGNIADQVGHDAQLFAPKATGYLASSIRVHMLAATGRNVFMGIGRRVTAHANYAAYVELGTRHHVIRPNSKKALWWPGAKHPMNMVRHPGTTPRPFLRPALYYQRVPN